MEILSLHVRENYQNKWEENGGCLEKLLTYDVFATLLKFAFISILFEYGQGYRNLSQPVSAQ